MASAENCVQITVSFNRQEEVLPLTIRPSLELSDYKVDAAEDELFKALRKAFAIESDDTFYLHEAESGRIMSKESFRDPGYCSNFPSHWYLVVERRADGKGNAGYVVSSEREEGQNRDLNHTSVEREMASMFEIGGEDSGEYDTMNTESNGRGKIINGPSYDDELLGLDAYAFAGDELLDNDDVMYRTLAELSPSTDTKYQSHTLHCDSNGQFGFSLRHFSIQTNAKVRSDTPQSEQTHSRSDSMASTDSFDTLRLTTTFIYHIAPGGVADGAGLEVGLAVQQINSESILRSSGEEIQQLLEQCGEELSLLVLPKDADDLQYLYPCYTYGEAGSHMTNDGLTFALDIEVVRGTGELENHAPPMANNPLVPNNVNHLSSSAPTNNVQSNDNAMRKRLEPPTGLIPFEEDGSQELSLGVDQLHCHQTSNSSGEFMLLSLHEIASKADQERESGYGIDPPTTAMLLGNGEVTGGRTGKKSLEFTPANLDLISEDTPSNQLESKWYNVAEETYSDHSLAQEASGKVDHTQSSVGDTNSYLHSSQPTEIRPRTRSQSSLLQKASSSTCSSEIRLTSRAGLTGSMSALDYLALSKRSHSTDLGHMRIKRKGRNSLEALTKIGGEFYTSNGGGSLSAIKRHRSDENTHRIKPQPLRSGDISERKVEAEKERPAWMQSSSVTSPVRPAKSTQSNEGTSSNTQLSSGSDYTGSAPRLAHSSSTEGKGRRARSYQSQRAKLHSSRSAVKISSSQDLSDSFEQRPTRSKRSVDRSDTSLEGSASQERSVQSDETLVEGRSTTNVQPVQRTLPVVQVEQQLGKSHAPPVPTDVASKSSSIGRHQSLKEGQTTGSPVARGDKERAKKNRPLSAVDANQFRHSALEQESPAHNHALPMNSSSSSNQFGQYGNDLKIPLYKTRSAQTPYGQQVFREVNIEEAIARSQMTQEGVEPEGSNATFEPVKKSDHHGSNSRRKEFGRKNAKSVDAYDGDFGNIRGSSSALRLSSEVLNTLGLGLGDTANQLEKDTKIHGLLNKKLDLTESGKRAPDRSWKAHYAVLAGDKLTFYKDRKDVFIHKPSDEPAIDVVPSVTTVESNSKKKFVFRIATAQGAEFLLQADDAPSFSRWVTAIQTLNIGQKVAGESSGTLQRPESSNKLAPNSPLMQRRSSSPQPQKTKRKDFMTRIRRVLTGQRTGDEPDSSSFITFGQSLEDCPVSADNKRVPLVVEYCVREVEEQGIEVEGIYRKPGQVNLIKSMSAEMDKGIYEFSDYGDIHTVGSLLKKFFKDLPDPAIPVRLYDEFIACAKESDEEERLEMLKKLAYRLPTAHYHTLKYLMSHLKKVAAHSDKNKMTYRNVSIVFGPTLLFKPEAAQDVLSNMNASYTIVQLLCQHVEFLFEAELCGEEQRLQEEATEQMRLREEDVATRGSPSISRHSETKMQKDQRLAKASPQLVRRIRNNLGSSEKVSNGKLFSEGMKRNSYSIEGSASLQPKQPNWASQPRSPTRRISDEYHGASFGGGEMGVANSRQTERKSRLRRPHAYEDVESAAEVMPVLTDSHARTRSWVESHNERMWAGEEVERSDSAEGYRHGDRHGDRHAEMTGSIWASKNRDGGGTQRGGVKERRQPRMTRLGHHQTAYAPPPMTVESDVIGPPFRHSSRTASLPNAHLPGMPQSFIPPGSGSRRIPPPISGTTHKPGSKRISYGMAVGISPIDIPDRDIPMRESSRQRRGEMDQRERFSSSDSYTSRMRSHHREGSDSWQTDTYVAPTSGSRSHTHQGHAHHSMYGRQGYNSLQRQMSPPQQHYQSSRRSSESGGDGFGGYILKDSSIPEHYPHYGSGHGGSRGRLGPQRTFSNERPIQRVEGVGHVPNQPNRESYL